MHTRRDFLRQGGRLSPIALGATLMGPLSSYPQESAAAGDDYFTGQPLRIGNELQVLMDETLIEDSWNLQRVLALPEKHSRNPILAPDQPWEGDFVQGPSVLYDNGRYRMWYLAGTNSTARAAGMGRMLAAYAESKDGITWTKPLLDVQRVEPFGKTNIVYNGGYGRGLQSDDVFIDPNELDSSKRYKMITLESRPKDKGFTTGINLATSSDGFSWKLEGDRHLFDFHSDTFNHVVHDPFHRRWILYGRPMYWFAISGVRNRVRRADGSLVDRHTRRKVIASVSSDLKSWSYPRIVMFPDERDFSDYDDCHVFRVGRTFVMLYSAMHAETGYANEIRLATSGDGFHWRRFHTREPIIPRGRPGDWDAGMTFMASSKPVQYGDRMFIYYSGGTKPQSMTSLTRSIGLAFTRPARLVALRADDQPGYVLTREFLLEGNRLRINIDFVSRPFQENYVRAEITHHPAPGAHEGFNPVFNGYGLADCDPVRFVDDYKALVTWKGNPDLSPLMGQPVYLRFEVRNMNLYGFSVTKE